MHQTLHSQGTRLRTLNDGFDDFRPCHTYGYDVVMTLLVGPAIGTCGGGLREKRDIKIGRWRRDLGMKLRGSRLSRRYRQIDQKLTGWSDRLSNLLDFLPKINAALWALIGLTGGTTFVSSLLVQTSANAGQGEQSSRRGERAWSPIRIRTMPPSLTSSTVKRKRMPASARSPLCQPRPRSRRAHGGLTAIEAVNTATSMPPVGTTFLCLLGLSLAPAPPR